MRKLLLLLAAALLAAGCGSKCDPSNCSGCCDTTGVCQLSTDQHCGLNGAACTLCAGLQTCQIGACANPGHTSGGTNASGGVTSSSSGSTGSTGSASSSTGGTTSSTGFTTSGTTSSSTTTSTTTTTGSTGSTSSTSATTSSTNGSTGSTGSTSSTAASTSGSGSTSATTTSTSSTGSTSGSSGSTGSGAICASCTGNGDCASGFCNLQSGSPGFCDSFNVCTGDADCNFVTTCDTFTGDCVCPPGSTSGSSGSTGTTTSGTTGSSGTTGTCASFRTLTQLTGPGTQQEVFGNSASSADYSSSCSDPLGTGTATPGPSDGYIFTTTQSSIFSASVGSIDAGTAIVSLTTGCGTAEAEQLCANSFLAGTASIGPTHLPAGTYNVRVTGYTAFFTQTGGTGEYDLQVALGTPVANDDCSGVILLALDGGAASVTLDTTNATDDSQSSPSGQCGALDGNAHGFGPDAVYGIQLTGGAPNGIRATLTPLGGGITPVVYIRSGPVCQADYPDAGQPTNELACDLPDDGGFQAVTATTPGSQPAGTYYIWVDSVGGTFGQMRLDIYAH